MKLMKHVPNALSILRVFLTIGLLFLAYWDYRWAFIVVYLIAGATDVFDGRIARQFKVESSLGSKLDAIGDSMLFGAAALSVLVLARLQVEPYNAAWALITLAPAVIYKLANVAVTKVRFGEWNMMHTLFNRTVFVSLFFCVPVFMYQRAINYWVILGISVAICLACFEETVTLLKMQEYSVNHNGLLGQKLLGKRAA